MQSHADLITLSDSQLEEISAYYFVFPYADFARDVLEETIKLNIAKYQNVEHVIQDKAFLWCAQKPNRAPIFLFGSLHETNLDFDDVLGDVFRQVLSQVEVCYNEIEDEDFFYLLKNLPTPPQWRQQLDTTIAILAYQMGKRLKVLETTEVRDLIKGKKMKEYIPYSDTNEAILNKNTRNYLQYIVPSVISKYQQITGKRNCFWMQDILFESLRQQASLVVCGGLHLVGQYGLPNLLYHEGYTLAPIMKHAPVPRSKVMRRLAFETRALRFFPPRSQPVLLLEDKNNRKTNSPRP